MMPPELASSPRVYVQTLGCAKNEADSRIIVRSLMAAGAGVVGDPEDATHILLNTCGFIREAKEESIGAILEACAGYREKPVLVMGCLVERYREELEEGIPEVAGWFGMKDSADLGRAVMGHTLSGASHAGLATYPGSGAASKTYAYVKISDGCNEYCSFCAIPAIKGSYRSVTTAEILEDADACLAQGARELVLVGQDTAVWEGDGMDLMGLIDLLAADERVRWVRVMYLQPDHVGHAFLRYMSGQPKLCRYLDVPFQHADVDILRRMGRRGSGSTYLELLGRARRLMPDVSIRSTFIVGFPGETEKHFERLLEFVEKARFDHAGGFVYSPEEGTRAASLMPGVAQSVAEDRLNRLNALLAGRAECEHERLVGRRLGVMIDSVDPDEAGIGMAAVGRTAGQAPEVDGVTYVEGGLPEGSGPGDVVSVIVNAAVGYDLVGACSAS